jgi:hypothetical protein
MLDALDRGIAEIVSLYSEGAPTDDAPTKCHESLAARPDLRLKHRKFSVA